MQGWYADEADQTDVRSVFLVRKRCLPIPFLQAFDLPDTTVSCARRDSTVVAPQALMLLNSPEGVRAAVLDGLGIGMMPIAQTVTDGSGHYELTGLLPGGYRIAANVNQPPMKNIRPVVAGCIHCDHCTGVF